jgi:tetratricopeptide (TPR) repeat protein
MKPHSIAGVRPILALTLATTALLLAVAARAQSDKINPNIPPPPPSASEKSAPPVPKAAPINPDIPPPPPDEDAQPKKAVFDPLGAQKNLEVGLFYLKKGNLDAAIDRFQESARLNTAFAAPYLQLGETYEKKGDPANALKAYKRYLRLYPSSPERKRVESRIADLDKKPQSAENKPAEK